MLFTSRRERNVPVIVEHSVFSVFNVYSDFLMTVITCLKQRMLMSFIMAKVPGNIRNAANFSSTGVSAAIMLVNYYGMSESQQKPKGGRWVLDVKTLMDIDINSTEKLVSLNRDN